LGSAQKVIARLGGALIRNPRERPGSTTTRRGLTHLHYMVLALSLFMPEPRGP